MARKTKDILITAGMVGRGTDNRDVGRTYRITEMSASKAEKWAARAWLAISHAGTEVPEGIASAGMVGFALYTFAALADAKYPDLEPLMDEMMTCVQFVMPINNGTPRDLIDEDIEEVETRGLLRLEVLHLHTGFTISDWLSKHRPKSADKTEDDTSTIQTSPG